MRIDSHTLALACGPPRQLFRTVSWSGVLFPFFPKFKRGCILCAAMCSPEEMDRRKCVKIHNMCTTGRRHNCGLNNAHLDQPQPRTWLSRFLFNSMCASNGSFNTSNILGIGQDTSAHPNPELSHTLANMAGPLHMEALATASRASARAASVSLE